MYDAQNVQANKSRTGIANLSIAVILGAASIALPAVAHACNTVYCNGALNCIYADAGFGNGLGSRLAGTALFNLQTSSNDKMSAWENKATSTGAWYVDADGRGSCITMPKGTESSYVGSTLNDQMTSWKVTGPC